MKTDKFRVERFVNPSGSVVWRVSGRLEGRRIRKNFPTEKAARLAAERLEVEAAVAGGRRELRATTLTPKQLRIAEVLFDGAADDAAVLALAGSVAGSIEPVPLKVAVSRFLTELERSGRRADYLRTQGYVLGALVRGVDGDSTGDLSEAVVRRFVFEPAVRSVTQADRRKRVQHFLAFCLERGWIVKNWAAGFPSIRVERELPGILSADELEALLVAARDHVQGRGRDQVRGVMLGYFLCAAFTGLRPEEARKLVLRDFHLDGELDIIEVSPRIAKVSQCRQVEVLPELVPVLQVVLKRAKRRGVEPTAFVKRAFDGVREAAEVREVWCNDVLRHTFASFHYALFKDVKRLTYTMGNSEAVLFQNYIRPMNARTAGKYLEILKDFELF